MGEKNCHKLLGTACSLATFFGIGFALVLFKTACMDGLANTHEGIAFDKKRQLIYNMSPVMYCLIAALCITPVIFLLHTIMPTNSAIKQQTIMRDDHRKVVADIEVAQMAVSSWFHSI